MGALPTALLVLSLAAPDGVGLIVAGSDPAAAGALQRRLEAKLAGAVTPTGELAAKLTSRPLRVPSTDLVLQREADRLLEATRRAFYEGNLDEALARLGDLDKLTLDSAMLPTRNRALMLLWRCAVLLEKQATRAAADPLAREAMAIAPDLVVDERSFPPQVVELASRARRELRSVKLSVTGLPAGARLRVDDSEVPGAATSAGPLVVSIAAGRHRLQAWAPGFDWVSVHVDVPADATLTLALPLALSPAESLVLAEAAADRASKSDLRALASTLGVRALAVVQQRGGNVPLAAFLWTGTRVETAPAMPPTSAGEDSLALWLGPRIRPKTPAAAATRASKPVGLSASAAAIAAVRAREASGDGGGYSALFGGAGARVSLEGTWHSWMGLAEGTWVSYALSPVTADLPDGGTARGSGGTTAGALLAGGWRWTRPGARFVPYGAAGLSFEDHRAEDLASGNGALRFFPSHRRLAIDVHAGARWELPFATLQGRLTLQPFSTWEETPSGASGTRPVVGPGVVWHASAAREVRGWTLAASLHGERRTVAFSGRSDAPLAPTLTDVTVTESVHSLSFIAGTRF